MKNCHIITNNRNNRLDYVLNYIFSHPLGQNQYSWSYSSKTNNDIRIYYDSNQNHKNGYSIFAQKIFFDPKKIVYNPICTKYTISSAPCYGIGSMINDQLNSYTFPFDIFESIFFHISRYEEYFSPKEKNDHYGWLEEKEHLLVKNDIHKLPQADILIKIFFEKFYSNKIKLRTTYAISHDIDILYRFKPISRLIKSLGGIIYHGRGIKHFSKSAIQYFKMATRVSKDPYDCFDSLIHTDDHWTEKIIFFIAGGKTKYEGFYSINHPYIKKIISLAKRRSYQIGIHPSYNAAKNPKSFIIEKTALESITNHEIVYNRQHWLRFDWDITPYYLESSKVKMDSSMGYTRHLGFRCGTGFPYKMYDFKNERPFSWIEYPLSFMESSAIHEAKFSKLSLYEVMNEFILLNDKNTSIMFNFHNSTFDTTTDTGKSVKRFYTEKLTNLKHKSHSNIQEFD